MTDRLYYNDSYLQQFDARVIDTQGDLIYLDRTAFYPTSGGQPFDTGSIAGSAVVEVIDQQDRIAHRITAPVSDALAGCRIDWDRRFDHMQQHTGQHLISAVLQDILKIETVSFHLGQQVSTIDIATPSLSARQIADWEERANQVIWENRPVTVSFHSNGEEIELRKASEREGELRVVSIEGIDHSACGGTHVRATGEIGLVLLGKLDKVRGNVRIEFTCGKRALRQARSDIAELSSKVEVQSRRLADAEKLARKQSVELAGHTGRALHAGTAPNENGLRISLRHVAAIEDEVRTEAQSFTNCGKAVMLVIAEPARAVLLASSEDSGAPAGDTLKPLLDKYSGRGGGNPRLAQGSVADASALSQLVAELQSLLK